MRKKVFQHAGALIIAAIILTFFTMSWAMYNNTAEQLRVSVRNECEYYRYFLDKMGDDSLSFIEGIMEGGSGMPALIT